MNVPMRGAHAAALLLVLTACSPAAEDTTSQEALGAAATAEGGDPWRDGLSWTDVAIPGVPAGARMAVVDGDLASTGAFVLRLDFPDGFTFPPHTHPTDEHVTVLEGSIRVGMGTEVDPEAAQVVETGGFITAPAEMVHYAIADGRTMVQVHGMGPFAVVLASGE